jgi:hypothetical protein
MESQVNSIFKIVLLVLCLLHPAFATPNFLTLSDIHYGSDNLSRDGEDTGPEFLRISMKEYKKISKNVSFILYLGDMPTHSLFNSSKKQQFETTIFEQLYANDTRLKPIFYITGNNDSLLGNYKPFSSNGISPLNFAPNWSGACAHCKGLVIDDSPMYVYGYYSSYVIRGNKDIILIALNATQWTKTPFFLRYPNQEKDAVMQLAWLEEQLKKHHAKQLLIAMHEPPGSSYKNKPIWHERYLKKFTRILNKYNSAYGEITLLTSHTHMEEVRKIPLPNGNAIYAYSTPSISRIHHNYPGMKVFYFNNQLKIKNFTTYYTSSLHKWTNQHYQALNSPTAIFPQCQNKTLHQCLDGLSTEKVCAHWDNGLFYGVKNPNVPKNICNKTYRVN